MLDQNIVQHLTSYDFQHAGGREKTLEDYKRGPCMV